MFAYLVLTPLFAFAISFVLPFVYQRQKKIVLESSKELEKENDEERISFPLMSLIIFSLSALVYLLSSDLLLFLFCGFLGIAAYTDACNRWIPDLIIYILLGVSVYSTHSTDLIFSTLSVSFYLMPVVLLSIYGRLIRSENWIASGDYYVFPSIGLMLVPEYASIVMLITLAIMMILMRWFKQIPLVTVAYFTFTGFHIWLHSGLL